LIDSLPIDRIQELEEYSQAIAEERDYVSEQLKDMESEVEKERKLREELSRRLARLQSKVSNRI
jgi:chromosome segregation ATPase